MINLNLLMASMYYIDEKQESFSEELFARMFLILDDLPFENTKEQRALFMSEAGKVITKFYLNPDKGVKYTQELAKILQKIGVNAIHYVIIRDCFLKTMKSHMGIAFTPTMRISWEDMTIFVIQILCTKVIDNLFLHPLWNSDKSYQKNG